MAWAIKCNAMRSRLHRDAFKGMLLNEYTGEVKKFQTRSIAQQYAQLSCFSKFEILEAR